MKQGGGGGSSGAYRKGHWSVEEDIRLIQFVSKYGEGRWSKLAKAAGLKRCGKSCRLRWVNYLRPDIKRGHISEEEERLIIRLHSTLGNRWSLIALHLPGRSDNEIKNYWRSHIKKKLKEEENTNEENQPSHIDDVSNEAFQNSENYHTTLIDGVCYNMAIGVDENSNGVESSKCTSSFDAINQNGFSHSSLSSFRNIISSEATLSSCCDFNVSLDHGKRHNENLYTLYKEEDTSMLSAKNVGASHDPPLNYVYAKKESLDQVQLAKTLIKLEGPRSDAPHQGDLDLIDATRPYMSSNSSYESHQQSILLRNCEVPWDIETMEPVLDASNTHYVAAADNTYEFELWENEIFPHN